MNQKITIGAMLEVPVDCLGDNYISLIEMLTVTNPEATTQAFFGSKHGQNTVAKKLTFYGLNIPNRSILLPRNISREYFPNATEVEYTTARGSEINEGYESNFKLRAHQISFLDAQVLPCINNIIYNKDLTNNIIPIDLLLNAECGSGKTVLGLYMAGLYGRTSLVTVTTKQIGKQFVNTVKALFPKWSIGWADDGKEYDITMATYSLLSQPTYGEKFFNKFGHIIFDEYHRAGAESYSKILAKATCQYRTTLTATFRRKDGLHKILKEHIGTILEMPRTSRKARIIPLVTGIKINEIEFRNVERTQTKVLNAEDMLLPKARREKLARLEQFTEVCVKDAKSRLELSRGMVTDVTLGNVQIHCGITFKKLDFDPNKNTFHKLGTVAMAIIDNEIVTLSDRNEIILKLVLECRKKGRKILILSKRKHLLYELYFRFNRYGIKSGVVISEKAKDYKDFCKKLGRTIEENREYTFKEADVILGIDKLAEEGMDIPEFDTIIFAHPVSDIEQPVGRITREMENKLYSLCFYLVDNISPYKKMWEKKNGAKQMFKELGHTIEDEINISQFKEMVENGDI